MRRKIARHSGRRLTLRLKSDVVIQKVGDGYVLKDKRGKKRILKDIGILNAAVGAVSQFIILVRSRNPKESNPSIRIIDIFRKSITVKKENKHRYMRIPSDLDNILSLLKEGATVDQLLEHEPRDNYPLIFHFIFWAIKKDILERPEGLLKSSNYLEKKKEGGKLRAVLSVLIVTVFSFDPRKIVHWMYHRLTLKTFISPSFLIPFSALPITVFVTLIVNGFFSYSPPIPKGFIHSLVLFDFFWVINVVIHEFAHAIVCKHWGGEVGIVGLRVFFFIPMGFSNVSDSYMLDSRSKRLSVFLAGPAATFIMGMCWGSVWMLAERGSFVSVLAYYLCLASIFQPVFGFIPLLRFDGYYIFTEIIGIYNLRAESQKYTKKFINDLIRRRKSELFESKKNMFLLLFGSCAFVFMFLFLCRNFLKLVSYVYRLF